VSAFWLAVWAAPLVLMVLVRLVLWCVCSLAAVEAAGLVAGVAVQVWFLVSLLVCRVSVPRFSGRFASRGLVVALARLAGFRLVAVALGLRVRLDA